MFGGVLGMRAESTCLSYRNGVPWTEPQSMSPVLTSLASRKAAISCCLLISRPSERGMHCAQVLMSCLSLDELGRVLSNGSCPEEASSIVLWIALQQPNGSSEKAEAGMQPLCKSDA